MKNIKHFLLLVILLFTCATVVFSQEPKKPLSEMTKEEMLDLTYDDLLNLPFEDLIAVADKLGMSSDELLEFFLNKDITSASKRAEKSLNSPLSSTVISKEEIEKSGATSLPEILRLVPGMIVREKTPGNFDVHIRGNDNIPPKNMFIYSENSLSLVMIDGRPVYNFAFGGTFWETIPIEVNDVERIEVIRGPSSALYGPNAVSGAINIITKKAERKQLTTHSQIQMGNNNAIIGSTSVAGGITDKLKFRMSSNYTKLDRFQEDFYLFKLNKSFTRKQLDTMKMYWDPNRSFMNVVDNMEGKFPDASLATDKFGINGFFDYTLNKDVDFSLALGTQKSNAISSSLGNIEFPIFGRTSDTRYVDFKARAYGFQLQTNYNIGDQWYHNQNPGWHIDTKILYSTLEYEKTIGTLVLRPGVSFQQTTFDDSKYIDTEARAGFLNGEKALSSISYFLRADYKAFDKLRLIAAVRGDKYNKPDDVYYTYQFIGSYDINQNNVVRAVYSRANRGPFITDTHSNYDWVIIKNPMTGAPYYTLEWRGNDKLKLPVMDMYELGYRTKLTKNIMVDLEAFQTTLSDVSYFLPDSMTWFYDFVNSPNAPYNIVGTTNYYNFDLKSTQQGITLSVSVALNKDLNFKVFGTYSQTELEGYYPKTIWNNFDAMNYSNKLKVMNDGAILDTLMTNPASFVNPNNLARGLQLQSQGFRETYTSANADIVNGKINPDSLVNVTHKATPSFYGGFVVDYTLNNKLSFNTSAYFYGEQEYWHNRIADAPDESVYTVKTKVILNLKVNYKFTPNASVFFNARNLLNDDKNEFAYLDKIKGLYLVGLNIAF
jgi:iron complex outermembrane receptor protein